MLHFNFAYHITEELIFYVDKLVVMGNSKNSRVFNFTAILLELRKFDAREIYMFCISTWVLAIMNKTVRKTQQLLAERH